MAKQVHNMAKQLHSARMAFEQHQNLSKQQALRIKELENENQAAAHEQEQKLFKQASK